MNILLIDPGLYAAGGHNAALLEEFARELAGRQGVQFSCACSVELQREAFAHVRAELRPVFRDNGFAPLALHDFADPARTVARRAGIIRDLWGLDLGRWDIVLMPTVYPLHLSALADCAGELRGKLSCGLLLPAAQWAADSATQAAIRRSIGDALQRLAAAQVDCLAYSETGAHDLGAGLAPTPTLLPPVSQPTQSRMAALAATRRAAGRNGGRMRVGFFGQWDARKGSGLITDLLRQRRLPRDIELVVRVPEGRAEVGAELSVLAPQIDFSSRHRDNEAFLAAMAEVDIVLAHYDPAIYGDKMSGIVPEALCLGKPLLVADGCNAVIDFLDRYAPGSFVVAPYHTNGLAAALTLPAAAWTACAQRAAASAPLMRSLKSMRRYLGIVGAADLYEGAAEVATATQAAPRQATMV